MQGYKPRTFHVSRCAPAVTLSGPSGIEATESFFKAAKTSWFFRADLPARLVTSALSLPPPAGCVPAWKGHLALPTALWSANCQDSGWTSGHQAMLFILFLLSEVRGFQPEYDSEKLFVQIVVPEKTGSVTTDGVETQVSYNIEIKEKIYAVRLTQKKFLPSNFRVYRYNGTEIMQPFEEQFQELCYYQGYIEGYPNSMVIVSTCTGLRGILQFENISYGIEPLEASIGFEHVIYQVKDKNAQFSLYTEKDVESRDLPYKIQSVQPSEFSQYIEMHVVVEKYLYNRMGSDTAIVTQKIFQLIGLTNSIFTSFNVTIILSSLELWIDENKIVTTGDANDLLHRFLSWKRSYLALRPHDVAFLLVYREKSNYVGATFQGKMCDKNYGGGVALHPRTISLESLSVIIAQLLSLSMGIAYDDVNKCQCPGRVCVMNPEAIHSSGVKSFSNCSMEDFVYFISKQKSHCLQNQPHLVPSYKAAVCGNGIVEEGEKCDCGSEEECAVTQPACCTAATCQLSAGSTCATGLCCENCQFQAKGRECRSSSNECDLPEYCNGSSELCQEDFFVQNGHSCGQNQWICLEGQCISGINQCSDLFGGEADFGNEECFNYLNSMADQSGSCGSDASGYKKCNPSDVNCGKLICIYTSEELIKIPDATTIYANISGHICVSIDYPYDHQENAKMWVKEGTVCGSNKVCKDHACVSSSYLGFDCTPQKCHQQGVCNNKKNCHCDAPYLPPDCQTMKNNWPGGSIDSGNYQSQLAQAPDSRGSYVEQRVYYPKPTRWPFFLFIPFFLVLCVLIAFLVKLRFQRKNERNKDYSSNEQLESECESKE